MLPPLHSDSLFIAFQEALAGRYSLERELGRGGMGIVYLARDVRLDRPVALKLLPPAAASIDRTRDRFLTEARMAARLAHPNIVSIYAVEELGGFVFIAMRFVAGETLGDRLRRVGRLTPRDTSRILRDVAYALAYAHAQGVIHRDIKPDNILLESDGDRALVTDFGIAGLLDGESITESRVIGTPEYMSPEQAGGGAADGRADLYALGAMGFHCLTGAPPFRGDATSLIAQHLTQPAPVLADAAPTVPVRLASAIDRALLKDPAARWPDAEAMAEAVAPAMVATSEELPVPVRIWAERGRDLKAIYVIWSLFFYGIGTMAYVAMIAENGRVRLGGLIFLVLCAGAAVLPWAGHALWRLIETRRALEAGASMDQLQRGTDVTLARREEELQFESQRPVHVLTKLVRFATYAAFSSTLVALLAGVFFAARFPNENQWFAWFALSTMATVAGGMVGLILPGRRIQPRDIGSRMRRWFWKSRLGELFATVAGIGLDAVPTTWANWRPTEIALGSATEALFNALPADDRRGFDDLPDVVTRLEQQAARAREEMRRHQGDKGWETRLESAVAAIETIRVGLLRLHARDASPGALTADLDAARDLAVRIDYLMEAEADVSKALDRSNQNSTHAAPSTPAPSTSLG